MIPVFITSKGRPQCLTAKVVSYATIVIEPQEVKAYAHHKNKIMVLPKNDQGLVYARNHILNYCKENNIPFFWLMDDDFRRFYKQINKKNVTVDWETIKGDCEDLMTRYPDKIGLMGHEYRPFIWAATKKFAENNVCDCCVLINSAVAEKCQYDPRFKLKIDRDFSIQVKRAGWRVIKQMNVGYDSPENGSNKGGLKGVYDSGVEEEMSKLLCEKWKGYVEMNYKKNGRPDAKILWNRM